MKWETTSMRLGYDNLTDILYIHPQESYEGAEKLEHAQENIASITEKVGDIVKGVMVFLPNHYINAEVTLYYKKNVPEVPMALIENSPFKRMLGRMVLSVASPKRPLKIFDNEDQAYEWLIKQIEKAG
jgi:uncharacterized protein YuzE